MWQLTYVAADAIKKGLEAGKKLDGVGEEEVQYFSKMAFYCDTVENERASQSSVRMEERMKAKEVAEKKEEEEKEKRAKERAEEEERMDTDDEGGRSRRKDRKRDSKERRYRERRDSKDREKERKGWSSTSSNLSRRQ